jgi:hypothetical protein
MSVEADDPLSARRIAEEALIQFPSPLPHDKVKHMIVENREFVDSRVEDLSRKVPIREDVTNPER